MRLPVDLTWAAIMRKDITTLGALSLRYLASVALRALETQSSHSLESILDITLFLLLLFVIIIII